MGWGLGPVTEKFSCAKMGLFGGMSGRFGAVEGPPRVRDVGITLPTSE